MNRLCALLLAACLCVPVASMAQTPAQVAAFAKFLNNNLQDTESACSSLNQMTAGLAASDVIGTALIKQVCLFEMTQSLNLQQLALAYQEMKDARDRQVMQRILVNASHNAASICNMDIGDISSYAAPLRSPAAALQAQKIRDLIQTGCDRVNGFAPPAAGHFVPDAPPAAK